MIKEKLAIKNLTKNQIEQLNLTDANSILLELKNNLHDKMAKLIAIQVEESERRIIENIAIPFDKWTKHTYVEVNVKGISAQEYFSPFYSKF